MSIDQGSTKNVLKPLVLAKKKNMLCCRKFNAHSQNTLFLTTYYKKIVNKNNTIQLINLLCGNSFIAVFLLYSNLFVLNLFSLK